MVVISGCGPLGLGMVAGAKKKVSSMFKIHKFYVAKVSAKRTAKIFLQILLGEVSSPNLTFCAGPQMHCGPGSGGLEVGHCQKVRKLCQNIFEHANR